ncbi:MAG: hypothetical protein KJZ73_10675 [Pseudorhodoplanes sp.]|nr:hypothetical protein [Pseudorhodoplanes sp.]MCL4711696.1 hypothetical protein [Pseudorhodoplanes sp.]GIK80868.1 MAG: hypothetical protein BroJett024_19730 [Alphaproteobacteria bacterium]
MARRRTVRKSASPDIRAELVAQLWTAAERQADDIAARLAACGAAQVKAGHDARALAVLVQTLKGLSACEAARSSPTGEDRHAAPGHDDTVPRDIDALRRALARRLDRLVADAKAACPDEA